MRYIECTCGTISPLCTEHSPPRRAGGRERKYTRNTTQRPREVLATDTQAQNTPPADSVYILVPNGDALRHYEVFPEDVHDISLYEQSLATEANAQNAPQHDMGYMNVLVPSDDGLRYYEVIAEDIDDELPPIHCLEDETEEDEEMEVEIEPLDTVYEEDEEMEVEVETEPVITASDMDRNGIDEDSSMAQIDELEDPDSPEPASPPGLSQELHEDESDPPECASPPSPPHELHAADWPEHASPLPCPPGLLTELFASDSSEHASPPDSSEPASPPSRPQELSDSDPPERVSPPSIQVEQRTIPFIKEEPVSPVLIMNAVDTGKQPEYRRSTRICRRQPFKQEPSDEPLPCASFGRVVVERVGPVPERVVPVPVPVPPPFVAQRAVAQRVVAAEKVMVRDASGVVRKRPLPENSRCRQEGCGHTFVRAIDRDRHEHDVHQLRNPTRRSYGQKAPIPCRQDGCGQLFGRIPDRDRHEKLHLGLHEKEVWFCPAGCEKPHSRRDSMIRHINSVHHQDSARLKQILDREEQLRRISRLSRAQAAGLP
ncbi:hypothetical protein DFH06DRAFT_1168239 [Mycena polygramma]|nr:hypothetical protein DFH06DRAFT_1168239 [Mycena polygramma]